MAGISIVIPVYNEETAVETTIRQLKAIMGTTEHEIIAVNDGSTDKSKEILEGMDVKLINHPYNLGYGAALKTGIKAAKYDYILITDTDGTYPIEEIPKLLKYAKEYDMVVGARTGKNVKVPLLRKPAKLFLGLMATMLTGKKILDLNSGMRIFKKELAMEFMHLFPQGFSFTTTITLAALTNGYTVKYVPINYHKRIGKSSIKPIKDFIGFTTLILKMITYFNPLKTFSLISTLLFLTAVAIFLYTTFVRGKVLDITVTILFVAAVQVLLFGLVADLIVKERKGS